MEKCESIPALEEPVEGNRLTIGGHIGNRVNEVATLLAPEGASKALLGPKPFCGYMKTSA